MTVLAPTRGPARSAGSRLCSGVGAALVAILVGCNPGAGSPRPAGPDTAEGPESDTAPACVEPGDESPLALLAGEGCPWVLEHGDGDGLRLRVLDTTGASMAGAQPPSCAALPCDFHGVVTPAGPVLVIEVPSAQTELPREVWLGLVGEGQLALIQAWSGPPIQGDAADLGPEWSLEPYLCGDRLALLGVARHEVGASARPPAHIAADEGLVKVTSDGLVIEPLSDGARARCELVPALAY